MCQIFNFYSTGNSWFICTLCKSLNTFESAHSWVTQDPSNSLFARYKLKCMPYFACFSFLSSLFISGKASNKVLANTSWSICGHGDVGMSQGGEYLENSNSDHIVIYSLALWQKFMNSNTNAFYAIGLSFFCLLRVWEVFCSFAFPGLFRGPKNTNLMDLLLEKQWINPFVL